MPRLPFPLPTNASEQPALIADAEIWSYSRYAEEVGRYAAALKQLGVEPGDRLGLRFPNCIEYALLLMAGIATGAILVPISTRFPQQQLASLLQPIGCRLLITDEDTAGSHLSDQLTIYSLHQIKVLAAGQKPLALPETIPETRPATIVFTSGSSGPPRGALLTYGNHYYSALGSNSNIQFQAGDRWLVSLPFYHVGGLAILFRALLGGGAVVVPSNPKDILSVIHRFRVTHLSLVATQLYRLLQREKIGPVFQSVKAVLLGGSAVPGDLLEKGYEMRLPLHTSYGLTEMASQVTATPPAASLNMLRSSGKLLPHRELKIDSTGEIWVRGKTRFAGYVRHGGLSRPFTREGWFATGDLGKLDEQGFLHVIGRKDNMFISGGENIVPEEIEQVIQQFEEISRAVVVPVEDKEFGCRPVAFIETRDQRKISPERLTAFLKKRLPGFKIPVAYFPLTDALTPSGLKVHRPALRELARKLYLKS